MRYQHHSKQQLREELKSLKFSISRDNPFRQQDWSEVNKIKARISHVQFLISTRKW